MNEARIKENLKPIDDNFHRLSLGSVMYDPIERTYFIPNMSTLIDAENKKIISSPNLQNGEIGVEEMQNKQNENNEQKEKTKVDDKDE